MKIIQNLNEFFADIPSAVTIGKFDGVHRGHRKLIQDVVTFAKEEQCAGRPAKSVVIALDNGRQMLLTLEERRRLLREIGVDILIECTIDRTFFSMTAEEFIHVILSEHLRCVHAAVGEDFRFGRGRAGDGEMLSAVGAGEGFSVSVIPELYSEGEIISSTLIRKAVEEGRMERVSELLGCPLSVSGEVIHGRAVGRTIGFPTANIRPDDRKLLPPYGVYYTEAEIDDKVFHGVTNIGVKPTVEGRDIGVETYFFDCRDDLYGEELNVRLLHFARPEKKFEGLEELQAQISRDREGAREYFKNREIESDGKSDD